MKRLREAYLWITLGTVLLLSPSIHAQQKQPGKMTIATIRERFKLGSAFGDRDIYKITIEQTGPLRIKAEWHGTAKQLALILNGPGQVNYYARQDGSSPLTIDYQITQQLIARGKEWTVSIVNFDKVGSAGGTLAIEYPIESRKFEELPVSLKKDKFKGLVLQQPSAGTTQRTILEGGVVEIRYPDGTVKRISDGGYIVIKPNGETHGAQYIQVPPNTPPALPGDERIVDWLEWQNGTLLDFIQKLIDNDETAINYYLQREGEKPRSLYEKMYLRTRYIERLLTAPE